MADLIPTGRTSLVKRGDVSLQVQTEYAHRPNPRITTTVQKSGQVLQKIERSLEQPIASIEEKNRMEDAIKKQHSDVIAIIKKEDAKVQAGRVPVVQPPRPKPTASPTRAYPEPGPPAPAVERIRALPGIHRLCRLDNEGNFDDDELSREFRKEFKPVFKGLHQLISIFGTLPGIGLTRESGVYEVERDVLYLISTGLEFYILHIEHADCSIEYENAIRDILRDR